jgi:hypothetical protein
MLEKYRNSITTTLKSAKDLGLSDLVLNLELSISSSSQELSSILYCRGPKSAYSSFLKAHHAFPLSEVIPDHSLSATSRCPELQVTNKEGFSTRLSWSSPFTCLLIWACKSQSLQKLSSTVAEIEEAKLPIDFFSVCLDGNESLGTFGTGFVDGLGGLTKQGFEVSEVPCFVLLRESEVYAVLDLSHNIVRSLKNMVDNVPAKVEPRLGANIEELKESHGFSHLIVFPDPSNDYFSRHLTQILDENPDISSKVKVTFADFESFSTLAYCPGSFCIVHNSTVVFKSDTSCTDIYHVLKSLTVPTSLSSDDFSEKKSRFDYSESQWQEKYPFCPKPNVVFNFKKTFFINTETPEEKSVSLKGSYLTVHKEYIEEFFSALTEFFPYAVNSLCYEAPSHTISPGEQCSVCDELLGEVHYLCVYCKPAVYVCQNCSHLHPLFRFTAHVARLDHLTWGAFNLNVGKNEGGESCEIICNACEEKIFGIRWKCAVCSDFDICNQCVSEAKSHSKEHLLIRMNSN